MNIVTVVSCFFLYVYIYISMKEVKEDTLHRILFSVSMKDNIYR